MLSDLGMDSFLGVPWCPAPSRSTFIGGLIVEEDSPICRVLKKPRYQGVSEIGVFLPLYRIGGSWCWFLSLCWSTVSAGWLGLGGYSWLRCPWLAPSTSTSGSCCWCCSPFPLCISLGWICWCHGMFLQGLQSSGVLGTMSSSRHAFQAPVQSAILAGTMHQIFCTLEKLWKPLMSRFRSAFMTDGYVPPNFHPLGID